MSSRVRRRGSGLALTGFFVASAIVAAIGGFVTVPNIPGWYHHLARPSWTPPDAVFGPAWTVLYILMSAAAWLVWRIRGQGAMRHDRQLALRFYWFQLALNACWSPLFFGFHLITVAFVNIALLLIVVILTVIAFLRVAPFAAILFAPYVAWVSFASSLNLAILIMNRGR